MTDFLLSGSYLAIVIVLILTGVGLPIPEEVPIIAAGVLSSPGHDQLNPWLAFVACLVGAVLGDCASYWVGFHFGRSVIHKHRYWARYVTPEREAKIEQMIRSHGLKMFFLARFLIGLRSTIYVTAGILRMSFRRFILTDLACATVIIGVFFGLSYAFGEVVTRWIRRAEWTVTAVVVVVVVAVLIFVWRRGRTLLRSLDDTGSAAEKGPSASAPQPDGKPKSDSERERVV